jgi:hypothetical protein
MSIKHFFYYASFLTFLWCSVTFADETEVNNTNTEEEINTTETSGGNQIIVSSINMLLDLGELGYATALVLDGDGNPIEGVTIRIIPQDKRKASVKSNSFITNESGYVHFSILGKQQGDTIVTVSDDVISSQINVAIRNLIHYVLPYFYGDMQLNIVNPIEDINYVKIQFHENSDRLIPPVIIRLDDKEMKAVKLSEELNITLRDGWAEIYSAEIIFGGVWTSKGYLPFSRIEE